jgi:hypothetical protein
MSESYPTVPLAQPPEASPTNPYGTPPVPHQGYDPPVGQPYDQPYDQPYAAPYGHVPGKIRGTGMCILLTVVTFGIYSLVWFYSTHDEMKRHTGHGLGGGLALLLAFLVGIVMPYITSSEVGVLYERAGQRKPVSGATGLWYFPGMFILIGPLVWFIQTNGALNAYWRAQGLR